MQLSGGVLRIGPANSASFSYVTVQSVDFISNVAKVSTLPDLPRIVYLLPCKISQDKDSQFRLDVGAHSGVISLTLPLSLIFGICTWLYSAQQALLLRTPSYKVVVFNQKSRFLRIAMPCPLSA